MAPQVQNVHGVPFSVGDEVLVRAMVKSINGTGPSATVTLLVDYPQVGPGDIPNVVFTVGSKQVR